MARLLVTCRRTAQTDIETGRTFPHFHSQNACLIANDTPGAQHLKGTLFPGHTDTDPSHGKAAAQPLRSMRNRNPCPWRTHRHRGSNPGPSLA